MRPRRLRAFFDDRGVVATGCRKPVAPRSPNRYTGGEVTWDTGEIRREREEGWFREHEAELIAAARRRRAEAERERQAARDAQARVSHLRHCPHCGAEMIEDRIEEIAVEECPSCEGIFFHRGELETLLLRHDAHRRGFFRKLLGFEEKPGGKPEP
jgi:CRISPR/Cas system-associated protein Cas10 (large subunit of type III CRISPR-Cas system)